MRSSSPRARPGPRLSSSTASTSSKRVDKSVTAGQRAGTGFPRSSPSSRRRGPTISTGQGCLSDGVIGAWMALVCGVGPILDQEKVRSHATAVHKYNLKKDLSDHANAQRPAYALGKEGGLLFSCTWPNGGRPTLPFIYSGRSVDGESSTVWPPTA